VILNYMQYGNQGPHLIILHGLLGMLDNWHTLATKFGETMQVWTIDQRNHGKSPHVADMNYALMAEDLKEFMTQHSIPSAHVLGHSMGGKTAMQFSFLYPELIEKLIVVDIAPRAYDPSHDTIIDSLKKVDFSKVKKRSDADEQLAILVPDFSVRQFLLKNLAREGDTFKWKMNLKAIEEHYPEISAGITAKGKFDKPTLFLCASDTKYVTDDDKVEILQKFPAAQFVFMQSGHWIHAEAPDQFYEATINFLL